MFECEKDIRSIRLVEDEKPKDTKLGDYMIGLILGLVVAWLWVVQ